MEEETETPLVFKLTTLYYRPVYLTNKRSPKKLPVFLTDGKWTFSSISILINEMHDFVPFDHSYNVNEQPNCKKISFKFQMDNNPEYQISIKITDTISVKMSTKMIIDNWEAERGKFYSTIGADNKPMKTPKLQLQCKFSKIINDFSYGSKVLFYKKSMIYNSKYDFSKIFHFFIKRLIQNGLPHNNDTEMIYTYFENFCLINNLNILSVEDLSKQDMKGYFKLFLKPRENHKRLAKFVVKDTEFSKSSGVFVMPMVRSLFEGNQEFEIDGFILDTTWSIMENYVTAILMASFLNTSLPLAFSFGNNETKSLYRILLSTVEEQLDIDFAGKIMESDQGKPLLAVCEEFHMIHLACLKHLLTSLKNFDYAYEVTQLVKCESEFELINCKMFFAHKFTEICQAYEEEYEKVNLALEKVGLLFIDNQIIIDDEKRWDEVSMAERCFYQMPSTTNTLEATHGHLNKRTPRRNTFYQSVFRIFRELSAKYLAINYRIKHNYMYTVSKTQKKLMHTSSTEINNMIAFYESTVDGCNCGNNKLLSSIFKIDIPCIHRVKLGANFENPPQINVPFHCFYEEIIVEHEMIKEKKVPQNETNNTKEYIYRVIKHFSRHKEKQEIRDFIDSHFDEETDQFFISNQQVSTIQLIGNGIHHFRSLKKNI